MSGRQTVPNGSPQVAQQPQVRSILPINGINDILAQTRQSSTHDNSTNQPVSVELALERFLKVYLPKLLGRCGFNRKINSTKHPYKIDDFCHYLSIYMIKYHINTPIRQAMFLAQVIVESKGFADLEEGLGYRDFDNMIAVGMSRFQILKQDYKENYNKKNKTYNNGVNQDTEILKALAIMYQTYDRKKSEFISKYSYNGFHGRGLKQLTWYSGYKEFADIVNKEKHAQILSFIDNQEGTYSLLNGEWVSTKDVVIKKGEEPPPAFYIFPDSNNSEMLEKLKSLEYAVWSACWFFDDRCIKKGKGCVDACNVNKISSIVNGGKIGLEDRKKFSKYALNLLLDLNKEYLYDKNKKSSNAEYDTYVDEDFIKSKIASI